MDFSHKTRVMAILNVTPDSFSDGGRLKTLDEAVRAASHALAAGADILDIGGESTRPGAQPVDPEEETQRVLPVIRAIHRIFPHALISIDTRKACVAEAALEAGAGMINDVSGLSYDPQMAHVAARYEASLVIMHSQGDPETMQRAPSYPDGVVQEVKYFFERQVRQALRAGVQEERILLDPGFGFGKTLTHNLTLFSKMEDLATLGFPLLAGLSRKSFLTLGNREIGVQEREALTAAAVALAIRNGASYLRLHDVETQLPVVRLAERLLAGMDEGSPTEGRAFSRELSFQSPVRLQSEQAVAPY